MRRRYVISYDVANDKRRTKLYQYLLGYGEHIQFSVFLADLTRREVITMRTKVRELMNEREDQCLIVDLGRESRPLQDTLEVIGKPYSPPVRTNIV